MVHHVIKDEDQLERDLRDFLQEKYPETDLEELRSKIDSVEIKNIIKSTDGNKIPRLIFLHQVLCIIQLDQIISLEMYII